MADRRETSGENRIPARVAVRRALTRLTARAKMKPSTAAATAMLLRRKKLIRGPATEAASQRAGHPRGRLM